MNEKREIKPYKQKFFNSYAQIIKENDFILFAEFKKLTVKDSTQMRTDIRKLGSNVLVIRNKIAKKAFEKEFGDFSNMEDSVFIKNTMIAYGKENVSEVAKVLKNYAKNEAVTIKAAIFENAYLNKERAISIANLPTKEQLLGMLANVLASPITNLARDLSDVVARLPRALAAVAENK